MTPQRPEPLRKFGWLLILLSGVLWRDGWLLWTHYMLSVMILAGVVLIALHSLREFNN